MFDFVAAAAVLALGTDSGVQRRSDDAMTKRPDLLVACRYYKPVSQPELTINGRSQLMVRT